MHFSSLFHCTQLDAIEPKASNNTATIDQENAMRSYFPFFPSFVWMGQDWGGFLQNVV